MRIFTAHIKAKLAVLATAAIVSSVSLAQAVEQPKAAEKMEGVWLIRGTANSLTPIEGEIPFTEAGLERFKEHQALAEKNTRQAYDEFDITKSRCSSPGVPRLMLTPMKFKIHNQMNVVTFDFEWNRAIRQVDLTTQEKELPLVPNINGISTGQWEGNTLVINTFDFTERTLLDDLLPHSRDLKVTERLTLSGKNKLVNRITIDDPQYYSQPWVAEITYRRQKNQLFPEDVCLDRLQAGLPAFP